MYSGINILLSAYCVILFITNSNGQNIHFGVGGDIVISGWSEEYNNLRSTLSYAIGPVAQYSLRDRLKLGTGILYGPVRTRVKETNKKGYITVSTIQVPIYADYQLVERISVHAGLQPSAILSAKLKIKEGSGKGTHNESDEYASVNFALIFGVMVGVTDNITALFRFDQGLPDIETAHSNLEARTRCFHFGIRYWIR